MKKKINMRKLTGLILVISLFLSLIFSMVRLILAPSEVPAGEPYTKVKTDYILMVLECILGLVVSFLPSMISRRWRIIVPNTVYILYFIFLYCAIYLGEILEFYYIVPHWDTMLHAFSGAMLGAFGFVLVDLLNRDVKVHVNLSPFFVSLFAFCFALAFGSLWEIYEFSFDGLLGINMQKYMSQQGVSLVGHEALKDTMKDIITDAIAALLVSLIGYFSARKHLEETAEDL